ncbi:hypothetical protein D4Q52_22675 [Rhodopseudomonas palustris]|uniref:Uncharacterized protein n=1 Tax=Rhodopseudomonas palustris TaxID=1076 RepID=A0A418UYM3_RHOPL|nr:hypothetical protein D4Q52_22675 [Rhodopseudomonas palustris]
MRREAAEPWLFDSVGYTKAVMRGLDPPARPEPLRRGEGPRIHRPRSGPMVMATFDEGDGRRVKPGNDVL